MSTYGLVLADKLQDCSDISDIEKLTNNTNKYILNIAIFHLLQIIDTLREQSISYGSD